MAINSATRPSTVSAGLTAVNSPRIPSLCATGASIGSRIAAIAKPATAIAPIIIVSRQRFATTAQTITATPPNVRLATASAVATKAACAANPNASACLARPRATSDVSPSSTNGAASTDI